MVNILLANGFEEVEALTPCDMLRRAEIEVNLVSTENDIFVTGNHGISVKCDKMLDQISECEMVILPGGLPGVPNLMANEKVMELVSNQIAGGKRVGAICAAPWILGELELTEGKNVTCYPGFEEKLKGALISMEKAVTDGLITTSKAAGTAMDFAFEIIRVLKDKETSDKVKNSIYFN